MNNSDHKKIIDKINNIIKKDGIPSYVKKWKPKKMKKKYNNDKEFLVALAEFTKSYHFHSGIIYKDKYVPTKKQLEKWKSMSIPIKKMTQKRRMPSFTYSDKIGRITFYQFIGKHKTDAKKLEKLVKKHIEEWEKKNIKGLILDFRNHYGGNIFPLYDAFSNLFNNSTIYGWSNKKAKKKDTVWVNIENGKLKHNRKFLNDKINFDGNIAVIIGPNTGKSGEFASLMFYGRDNVKFFGRPSAGSLSANQVIKINNDVDLMLTSSLVNTVDGTFHEEEKIYPDKITHKPIINAKKWINGQNKQQHT
jgi:C-terminal processing protease CtpA/Prc